jgi:hypothetical protein
MALLRRVIGPHCKSRLSTRFDVRGNGHPHREPVVGLPDPGRFSPPYEKDIPAGTACQSARRHSRNSFLNGFVLCVISHTTITLVCPRSEPNTMLFVADIAGPMMALTSRASYRSSRLVIARLARERRRQASRDAYLVQDRKMSTRDSSPSGTPTADDIDAQAERTKQRWSRSRSKSLIDRGSTVQRLAHGRSHVVTVEVRRPRRPSRLRPPGQG